MKISHDICPHEIPVILLFKSPGHQHFKKGPALRSVRLDYSTAAQGFDITRQMLEVPPGRFLR